MRLRLFLPTFALILAACGQPLDLQSSAPGAHVVYDLSTGAIPLPNDAVRDADNFRLQLPTDSPGLSAADVEFRTWLNSLDAWSTTMPITAHFSRPVNPATITPDTVRVYEWGAEPAQVFEARIEAALDGSKVTVHAPIAGWQPGGNYAVLLRGGAEGLTTVGGDPVGPSTSFWYLRQAQALNTEDNQRAFPGATVAERLAVAEQLEELRSSLAPYFAHLEPSVPRVDMAALFSFTVTERVELAMDRESQRVPIPFDLLLNPDTGLVELGADESDSDLERDAKVVASTLDGFGLSPNLMFEFTRGIDPSTVTTDTVQLYDVSQTPQPMEIAVRVFRAEGHEACLAAPLPQDCKYVAIDLLGESLPLRPATTYALVLSEDIKQLDGQAPVPMLVGHFLRADEPLFAEGQSTVSSLNAETAQRLEGVRVKVAPLLDSIGRKNLLGAWPFTTMDPVPAIAEYAHKADELQWSGPPVVTDVRPAFHLFDPDALSLLFPGALNPAPAVYANRTNGVREVIMGTIRAPDYLDGYSRRFRVDGSSTTKDLRFWAVTPANLNPEEPAQVVIFGHAIVTDRRFLLTIAGELAQRGFVAVAIDWPYHGDDTACIESSLVAVPNFFPEAIQPLVGFEDNLIWLPPCASGSDATCSVSGECLGPDGQTEDFNTFPIIDMKPASGAAFMDTSDLPYIPHHFFQAWMDLSTLRRSLEIEDWQGALGQAIQTDSFHYAGQSLGSIIGAPYTAVSPEIDRMVFNVLGSNLVDLFQDSVFFRPQIEEYFLDQDIALGSWEQERLTNVASWIIDTVDPHSVAHLFAASERPAIIQIDRVDANSGDLIIPNHTTENFQRASGLPMLEYSSTLHADLIVPILGNAMLNDMAQFLAEDN